MLRTLTLLALAAGLALSADKPNLTGEWKLDITKSDFGMMPAPASMVRKIEHKDPEIKLSTTQAAAGRPERTTDVTYTTDGKPTKTKLMGRDATVKAKWDGAVLVIDTEVDYDGQKLTLHETIQMSGDGKTVNSESKLNTPMGENVSKLVFTKSN